MMRKILGCVAAWMLAAGLAQAQMPYPNFGPPPFPPPYPPPFPPPPPWAGPYPRYMYPPPPPPPYPPMYPPRYGYPAPYAAPTAEPPVAVTPKEAPAPAVEAIATAPAVNHLVDQDRGPCLRYWITPEYLYWIPSHASTVPLVTTGSATNPLAGVIGQPDTKVLFGNSINYPAVSGFRLSVGGWIDSDARFAVEAQGFITEAGVVNYGAASNGSGSPVLTVPVFNVASGAEGGFAVSAPALGMTPTIVGNVSVSSTSQLYGAEFNGYYNLFRSCGLEVDVLGGFRYLGLQESLTMNANASVPDFGFAVATNDSFSTTNNFFGGQLGMKASYHYGPLFIEGVLKAALGVNRMSVDTNGSSVVSNNGAVLPVSSGTFAGGILTQPSNIGHQQQMDFSVVPHGQLKVGWELSPNVRIFAGYDFMYWTGVVRAANQIDHNVNPTQAASFGVPPNLVGAPSPEPQFNRTNYYVQGVSAGIEFRY